MWSILGKIGKYWSESGQFWIDVCLPAVVAMTLEFCAQESCRLDSAGRLKLGAGVLKDFQRHTAGDVVLYCVPEGAVGIYPPVYWPQIRGEAEPGCPGARDNVVRRRLKRRFGALSQGASISNQARITIPPLFRQFAGLEAGGEVLVIGCENGVELWSPGRWEAEMAEIEDYFARRSERETRLDLEGGEVV